MQEIEDGVCRYCVHLMYKDMVKTKFVPIFAK